MIRVLQIIDCMDLGGIQAFIMNTYKALIPHDIQFDFMVFHERKQLYEDEICSLGGKIYKLPSRRNGVNKCRKAIRSFFQEHTEYKVVHYQTSSLSFLDPLTIAAEFQIPVRIIHSHSTKTQGSKIHHYLHLLNKRFVNKAATHYFSCGDLAAKWMFANTGCEKKVKVINNGIDISSYAFDEGRRLKVRHDLSLVNSYVIGIIGRLSEVKNHKLLLDAMEYIENTGMKDNAVLLVVGDGELKAELIEYAKDKKIGDKVIFLGTRKDVQDLLQAMDIMVMPSLYEGFPVAAVEAQAAGLPCVLSSNITKDVIIKTNATMLNLEDPIHLWATTICKQHERIVDNAALVRAGFDIKKTVEELFATYTWHNI